MPYMRKLPNKSAYRVYKDNGDVLYLETTKAKAESAVKGIHERAYETPMKEKYGSPEQRALTHTAKLAAGSNPQLKSMKSIGKHYKKMMAEMR